MSAGGSNICLVIYPVCVEGASPIYVYIGNGTYDVQYDIFTLDDFFIEINQPGYYGYYYTDGLCPAVISESCDSCNYNYSGALAFEDITIASPTGGETCYGDNCVTLQNCENDADQLIALASFSVYIGSVVKIAGSDKCWKVIEGGSCSVSQSYTVTKVCDDCETCLPVPEVIPPKVEPQYFEDFTQTAETQNEIATNVKFANAYWDLYKSLKHGIESVCTNIDTDKITVKKKLCDITKLYDENACIIPAPAPEPEVCEEPTGTPLPEPFVS